MSVCVYCKSSKICNILSKKSIISPKPSVLTNDKNITINNYHKCWYWEGNIQSALVDWIAKQGGAIRSAADTAAKSAGKDIIAEYDGRTIWISVKGFPRGTTKTNPPTQARHWFSHAVFDLILYRNENTLVKLGIALPDGYITYLKLADRVEWLRSNLPFTFYWVSESGDVRLQ